jgi:hypothetical protein
MSRAVGGVYIKQHLHDFHLTDIVRIAEAGAKDHETQGCRYAEGWQARLEAKLLAVLPDIVGDHLEAEEVYCPERGIGAKEAA